MKHSGFHHQVLLSVGNPSSHGQVDHRCRRYEVEELSRLAVEEVELAKGVLEVGECMAVLQEECR